MPAGARIAVGGPKPHKELLRPATFNVVARYRTKAGTTDEVLGHLENMAAGTRNKPGNISYEFSRGVEDDSKIVIHESNHTTEDFGLHRQTPHFLTIGAVHSIPELESRTVSTYVTANSPVEAPQQSGTPTNPGSYTSTGSPAPM
ncbi:putative quinol monooxygenase [Arthrobacter sp. MMS18-M83]|uniref:putative quinol monooxygenase n=1 Tax=Arthrobacter sp. MMS18-M83 TaxID=2996261 RepID=UPI00227B5EAE|nr:antibiotic biosynthesis monooxygenase family protein [Arthrobacter sp. MMS18-M83]WAH96201.1 antibiotic biosynthesis monooxygenase [Arthrobacter sp. MMS18-M83]